MNPSALSSRGKNCPWSLFLVISSIGFFGQTLLAQNAATNAPLRRYLFVVDTSYAMANQKETLRNTAYDLIFDGIDGQMRAGDQFIFWAYDERTYAQQPSALTWDPAINPVLASQAYKFLKGQLYQKPRRADKVFSNILNAVKAADALTVFLLSDGFAPVEGTPFDREINAVYETNSLRYQKAGKPFITVLVASGGEIVAWKVTTVGEAIGIPAPPVKPIARLPEAPPVKTDVPTLPPHVS